jgi:hypothetical protein
MLASLVSAAQFSDNSPQYDPEYSLKARLAGSLSILARLVPSPETARYRGCAPA